MSQVIRLSDIAQREQDRLKLLRSLSILDTPADAHFDRIAALTSKALDAPIALISLVDERRQWFKSAVGLDVKETPREHSFCRYAMTGDNVLVVEDAHTDHRFRDNLLVTGAPHLRFYAGAPLRFWNGLNLGTLCVLDLCPRKFGAREREILKLLAETVVDLIGRQAPPGSGFVGNSGRSAMAGVRDGAESKQDGLAALRTLTGGVAHEFNNLIGVIVANLGMIGEVPGMPRVTKRVAASLRAAERGRDITRKLLSFSGQDAAEAAPVDVNQAVDDGMAALRTALPASIKMSLHLDRDAGPVAVAADELANALTALVDNSVAAMPDGGRLVVETARRSVSVPDPEGDGLVRSDRVIISVSDTGVGMSTQTAAHATEPFYTTREPGAAAGLGLSVVHGFASRHGGSVSLWSIPGRGTTVSIDLPRAGVPGDRPAGLGDEAPVAGGDGRTVLVVDDDAALRIAVGEALTGLGYRVRTSDSARQAMADLASPGPIDVLVADLVLSDGLTGCDVIAAAAHWKPETRSILTTGLSKQIIDRFVDLTDAGPILPKPYDIHELDRRIRDALSCPAGASPVTSAATGSS